MNREAVIVCSVRTPVGRCRGALSSVSAIELGALAIGEAVKRAGINPEEIDDVIFGNLANDDAANMARVASLTAGLPYSVTGLTIDRQCSSGLNAIALASIMILAGYADVMVAGGVESDSNRPYIMEKPKQAYQVSPPQWMTRFVAPGELNVSMGITAENLSEKYGISRVECDAFAMESHKKASVALENHLFKEQIIPVPVKDKKGNIIYVDQDECVRKDCSMESLGKLNPVFKKDGVVTAGNSSPMSDGASAVVVMEKEKAIREGYDILAKFIGFAVTGCDPLIMGIGPVEAIKKVLKQTDLRLEDIDLIELNEAFASQSIACIKELGLDVNKLNVNGGAIALGHPLAGTGGILTAKLLYELRRRKGRYGIVSFCMAGGQGAAAVFESIILKK